MNLQQKRKVWRWDNKLNRLECSVGNPTKKSKKLQNLMANYIETKSTPTRTSINKSGFKKLVTDVTKVLHQYPIEDGKTHWSIESVTNLAFDEMLDAYRLNKSFSFFSNCVAGKTILPGIKTIDFHFSVLKEYSQTKVFLDFSLSLLNFFSVYYDLEFWKTIKSTKGEIDRISNEFKIDTPTKLKEKLEFFEKKLALAYANMLLGTEELKMFHHMSSGERRFFSPTVTDQILGEMILELVALIIFVTFRAEKNVTLPDIRSQIGTQLRSESFNPYHHADVLNKLDFFKNQSTKRKMTLPQLINKMLLRDENDDAEKQEDKFADLGAYLPSSLKKDSKWDGFPASKCEHRLFQGRSIEDQWRKNLIFRKPKTSDKFPLNSKYDKLNKPLVYRVVLCNSVFVFR